MDILQIHSFWFLVGLALFPRITLLFFAATPFGWLAWLGWLFTPHLLVAILSLNFWDKNPVLVVVAWLFALLGTGSEGRVASRR